MTRVTATSNPKSIHLLTGVVLALSLYACGGGSSGVDSAEDIADSAEGVADTVEAVADSVEPEGIAEGAEDVAASAEDVVDSAEDVVDSAEDVDDSAEDVAAGAEDVVDSAADVDDSAEDVTDSAEDGIDSAEDVTDNADSVADSAAPVAEEQPVELITQPVVSTSALAIDQTDAVGISEVMRYLMPSINGGVTVAQTVVLIPQGDVPAGGFPVVAWGHGAAGVANLCAPSRSSNLRGSSAYLNRLVENGYAVVAADFEGLGTADGHPYLNLASGGRSLVYAVNAAVREYEMLSNRYAVLGYSQGGHAALGAGELAGEVGSIELTGVAAIAPPSQVAEQATSLNAIVMDSGRSLADRAQAAGVFVLNSALLSKGVQTVEPDFAIESIFGSNGIGILNSLEFECVDDLIATAVLPITGSLFISGNVDSVISPQATELPVIQQYLSDLEPGRIPTDVPVLLMQGLLDEVVFPESTAALSNTLSAINVVAPTLIEYPGADHNSVVEQSAGDVLSFLNSVFSVR